MSESDIVRVQKKENLKKKKEISKKKWNLKNYEISKKNVIKTFSELKNFRTQSVSVSDSDIDKDLITVNNFFAH